MPSHRHHCPMTETWTTLKRLAGKLAEFEAALTPHQERPGRHGRGRQENPDGTTMLLWRPVSPAELGLLPRGRHARMAAASARSAHLLLRGQRGVGRDKLELWIPAGDLDELNRHLIGPIDVVEALSPAT